MTTDERFDRLENSIGEMTRELKGLVAALSQRAEDQGRSLSTLTQSTLNLRMETTTHLPALQNQMAVVSTAVMTFDARLPAILKALTDFGATHIQLANSQRRLTDDNFDLVTRVERLEEIVSKLVKPAA